MQTAFSALPKLPLVGHQAVAPPMRWAWRVEHELRRIFGRIGHQHGAPFDDLTLWRGPSPDARIEWATVKVSVAFFVTDLFDAPLNAHHPLELDPMKLQGRKRVAGQFLAFLAGVIGVPDDAPVVVTFDQHHPRAGAQIAGHGGQCHGVRLGHFGRNGFLKPLLKLLQGVGM